MRKPRRSPAAPRLTLLAFLALPCSVPMTGCTTTAPPPISTGDPVPEDGIVAAGVVVGSGLAREIRRHPERWPVHLRPGRAIVLPDGTLRADVGPSIGFDDRPGVTRHLRRAQLASLWRELDELGLGSSSASNFTGNPNLLEPGRREVVQLLEFQRDGRDWMVVDRFEIPEADPEASAEGTTDPDAGNVTPSATVATTRDPGDPRVRAAIRRIAALSWAMDLPPEGVPRFPERYDFGPDPWARYRTSEAGEP